jgi:catechol 2,3-dioxygenase-like lactoylglutathione lyase family enzyme
MPSRLVALSIDANDPHKLSRFWSGLLGWHPGDDGTTLRPDDDTGFDLRFRPTDEPKAGQNRAHFDLTSTSLEGQQQTVARALELGGRHTDVGQRPEEGHVVLADPDGNEFCVIEPGNNFLADCGFVGALACDGSQAVGYFWSEALGWPLVWDQDQETAIRSGDLDDEVKRLVSIGASRTGLDPCGPGGIGMADPDGNEFCLVPPR